jgi:hypothetical protein
VPHAPPISSYFETFRNTLLFYGEGLLVPCPKPKLDDHPLSAVRDCLFNIFVATLRIWRPSLHPQPEDARCHGDKGPTWYGSCYLLYQICILCKYERL